MRRSLLIAAALGASIFGALLWIHRRNTTGDTSPARAASNAPTAPAPVAATMPSPQEQAKIDQVRKLAALVKSSRHRPIGEIEAALRRATTPFDRHRVIGELLNDIHFNRDDAIRVLKRMLTDPDASVRVHAAEALYIFGSTDGKDTLLAVMSTAIGSNGGSSVDAKRAATILNRYREVIPADLLIGLQLKLGQPGVVDIMAMQADPRYTPYVLDVARKNRGASMAYYVGVMASPEGADWSRQIFDSSSDDDTKVAAAWATYRTSGNRTGLDYVLRVAESAVASVNTGATPAGEAWRQSMDELYITSDSAVREFLRTTINTPQADINAKSLASLYYVQHDDAFVDEYLGSFLQDATRYRAQDSNLIWHIAAARNLPEYAAQAKADSPDFYAYFFTSRRSVESWISSYLGVIPKK